MPSSRIARTFSARKGFALIVTLSMMILLAMIAIGLLTLSSISLRSSTRGESVAAARANSRVALMMALGQLQRELGPDSRISAPHDAGSMPPNGQPRWTAVYDAWQSAADMNTPENPATRNTKFRNWLVSGATSMPGGVAGTGEMVQLVGPNSLAANGTTGDQISIPVQNLSAGTHQGRLGWWVADESTKAKINAGPDAQAGAQPLSDAQSPPNVGHQSFASLEKHVWQPGQRSAVVSTGSVNLAAGLASPGIGNLSHHLTVHSAGVLCDVRAGRLKRDLSNLLARPIVELRDKPLYLADGRLNRFNITTDGTISNASNLTASTSGGERWGINLEELHLFHELHREINWSGSQPRLVCKGSRAELANDSFYIYKQPVIEAMQVTLSLKAVPDAAPGKFKMQSMLDAIIGVSNPNDIDTEWPSSLVLSMEMHSIPYTILWNIRKADGTNRINHRTGAMNRPFFKANVRNGITLKPGEAAVFGSSIADVTARQSNLTRGFVPRGGVTIADGDWGSGSNVGLRAINLDGSDIVDFTMSKAPNVFGSVPSGWILCPKNATDASSSGTALSLGSMILRGEGSSLNTPPMDKLMIEGIKPPQRLSVQQFTGQALPVMMLTLVPNVEKSRTALVPPNAFPSRPHLMREPAIPRMDISTRDSTKLQQDLHASQWVVMAEPMDYNFGNDRTLAAGAGGRNLYHGGSREVGLGGSFHVIKRRIPLSAPLSLGAFENAIACGLLTRFTTGNALSGNGSFLPGNAKAIGNSWATPFLAANRIFDGTYHDPSWMANTALWDSWFLSGIVQGANSPWESEARSPRDQFRDLAENTGKLRNRRFTYNSNVSLNAAIDELFVGDTLKPSAINLLPKYLLVDGAFNVNSTSEPAWKAMLSSVRQQELIMNGGGRQKFNSPFGTLGYAERSSTTDDWAGLRDLSDADIDNLAKAIVVEVKSRGPFLSLADFVNRRPNSGVPIQQALGALQAAIDRTTINTRYNAANRKATAVDFTPLAGANVVTTEPLAARAVGSPGYLSQAALLTPLGSQITVRGDTFLIRAYGDHRDKNGTVLAKSWCEAVVQRYPEFIDSTNTPDTSEPLTPVNANFGRTFKITSFRWLNSREI